MAVSDCSVNLSWSPPKNTGCPPTMYIIYFREIHLGSNDAEWRVMHVAGLKTTYAIALRCDTEYEIAVAARNEEKESAMSNYWRVKTNSGIYVNLLITLLIIEECFV